ncbi:MAG: DNA mismatch repair protein MutS [Pseudomonadota bacterium]
MSQDTSPKLSPMFQQYLSIKTEYPDALLFYRMGDFYELFFEDAEIAARELQIALTTRNPKSDVKTPMCGVPHHAAENYISQLVNKGYNVAICEQIEDPKQAKGLVKRGVIRVMTPATVIEDANLQAKGHNYLGALYWQENEGLGGFAWLDISTGEWSGLHVRKHAELWQWVQKMAPRELLVPQGIETPASFALTDIRIVHVQERAYFDLKGATERILSAQNVVELATIGLDKQPELTRACGALLHYISQTQQTEAKHLAPFSPIQLGRHLIIDEVTERNLEIFQTLNGRRGSGTLRHEIDKTMTPMGGRLLEERLRYPWRELEPINESQLAVAHLVNHDDTRDALRLALKNIYDLERLSTRISLNRAAPRDFVSMRQSLASLPEVYAALYETPRQDGKSIPQALIHIASHWDNLPEFAELLERAFVENPPQIITDGGLFKSGYHAELDELLDLCEHGEGRLQDLLVEEQEKTGISKLRLGVNRVFGYYFEASRNSTQSMPEHFIRRQTLANAERFTTAALQELEEKILSAQDKRKALEYKLFQKLRESLANIRPRLLFMADMLAQVDFWQSLAHVARRNSWIMPKLNDGQSLRIREGRHPVVEGIQGSAKFIPNDLYMDEKRRLLLITGPNMAGKSTVLRQTAIICLLAQMGSFVPATEAELGLTDRIFSRVGASDNLSQGQSTFMVEMMETARILRQATRRSLVILDEIGRGTSTFDGLALAWAVVEELARRANGSIRTLFATHYHEITALEGRIPGVHTMNIAIREWRGEIVFLRRLVPGPADKSYGIEVARLAGVPQAVVQRARQILGELEKSREGNNNPIATPTKVLLPGLEDCVPTKQKPAPFEIAKQVPIRHPILVCLADVDTNNITPIKALELLTEWKMLWGDKSQEAEEDHASDVL